MKKKIRALLLSAGFGTRLRPLTYKIPKCLVEINGESLLVNWLKKLENIGCDEVLINTHYRSSQVNKVIEKLSLNVPFHIGSCGIVSWAQYAELLKQESIDAVTVSNIHHMSEKANKSLRECCIIEKLNIRIPCKFAKSV